MTAVSATLARNRNDPWNMLPVEVRRFRNHSAGVFTVDLEFKDPDLRRNFDYAPGQFNMLYVPGVGESAISIAGTTATGLIQHTIRSVGNVTKAIELQGVGMSLGLRGPYGRGWPLQLPTDSGVGFQSGLNASNHADIIIVAGGIGLAPLRSMVKHIIMHRQNYGAVSILIGARTPDDLLYQDEYDDWRSRRITVSSTVDRAAMDWKGQIGVVTLLLNRLEIPRPAETIVLTCGPEVMMRYVVKSALGRRIPEQQIFVTLERNMNCAIGLCGHCQLGPKFICKEGPVFRYDEVNALLRVQEM
jgi:NAD(P)H-flavin reductase